MIIYHGSQNIVKEPEIRISKYTKDFSWGFYCTIMEEQAKKWSIHLRSSGYVNIFEYTANTQLKIKTFEQVDDEWLEFIAQCRNGVLHSYDIVEGPMADNTIYNYVERYLDGRMSKEEFLSLAKFKHPTHQISFHTIAALQCLRYIESKEIIYEN